MSSSHSHKPSAPPSESGYSTKTTAQPQSQPPKRPFSRVANATTTPNAPKPNGNYSHVIRDSSGLLHVCGWMGDDPKTGQIVEGGIQAQTNQILRNIRAVLETAGSDLSKIVQRRIYIIDMKELKQVDDIWGRWVKAPFPVSTCVGVTALAKDGARVEIEVVAES